MTSFVIPSGLKPETPLYCINDTPHEKESRSFALVLVTTISGLSQKIKPWAGSLRTMVSAHIGAIFLHSRCSSISACLQDQQLGVDDRERGP